jgi:hypothetical protein
MKPTQKLRVARALQIAVAALLVCGLPAYGQRLDPRMAPAAAQAAAVQGAQPAPATPLPQAAGTFMTVDPPGACRTASSFPGCTDPVAINPAGEILGYSVDANGIPHGFLRDTHGTFTSFDVPGTAFYTLVFSEGPPGSSLSPVGEATGGYIDTNGLFHGFVRDNLGAITTFDAPGGFGFTIPLAINPAGEVAGYFFDANFFTHGFFRDANGNVTAFDVPDASTACFLGLTMATGMNAAGKITGTYYDAQCNPHGFLRDQNGAFTVFDAPNSFGTFPLTINNGGEIAGVGADEFIRDQNGSFTVFDIPGLRDVNTMNINSAGVVVGSYLDANLAAHSFRRTPDGVLTSMDFPGAGTGFLLGTTANSINAAGEITGSYNDANGVQHGFLFLPD